MLLSVTVNGTWRNIVALLDSGTSQSLLNTNLADKHATIKSKKSVKWETKAGEFSTARQVVLNGYKLPQFTHRIANLMVRSICLENKTRIGTIQSLDGT